MMMKTVQPASEPGRRSVKKEQEEKEDLEYRSSKDK